MAAKKSRKRRALKTKPTRRKATAAKPRKKATNKKPAAKTKKGPAAKKRPPPRRRIAGGATSRADPRSLQNRIDKLTALLDVAKAMTAERDPDKLLGLILDEALKVVNADRCSIWVVERDSDEMWTKVAHGEKETIRMKVGVGIAGQVARTGEIINIPDAYADQRFNREVDKTTGYKTRNILAVPMRNTKGEVTGVVQALNRKDGVPFNDEDVELLLALGANAASALENATLYKEIDQLFEGFVRASVVAIESRDPTTSGHSERVANLTLGIAENLERVDKGPYSGICFSTDDMREIRYAALLHDFGKVGVRENVLVKENKLYPGELAAIETRFRALHAQKRAAFLQATIEALRSGSELPIDFEAAMMSELDELERFIAFIQQCNRPTVLDSSGFERLREIAELEYTDIDGTKSPILSERELERLSIPRGSLDQHERLEIESHVTHTFRFLSQIPWTRDLRRVPEIAYAHHEKLDGFGYPRQLQQEQIPIQSRMMTVADIYDALTASDRPYKRAVPHERALSILEDEAGMGKLDETLLGIFIEAKVHERVARR